ncbi:MAG: sigma 54-interacting transcriptional regulator [bacterium]
MTSNFGPHCVTLTVKRRRLAGPRYLLIPAEDRLVQLADGDLRVGTSPECGLVLADPTVSRIHCRIRCHRGTVRVRDLGSKNGVMLQGVRVSGGEVRVGDTLRLGNASLVLVDDDSGGSRNRDRLLPGMVGRSAVMQRMARTVRLLARSDLSVLVLGETGTGKELVARALHQLSARREGPFEALNCGAIPRDLVEAELFGHERGAFTGAQVSRPGIFERAAGGTLLLDEVGELPLGQQPKLLRVLETRQVRRVGGQHEIQADVRVVAATHLSLPEAVEQGRFRRDLLYRLNEAEVRVPPLSHRREDIPGLVEHFLGEAGAGTPRPDPATMVRLQSLSLAGNVRELRSLVRRAAVLGWAGPDTPTPLTAAVPPPSRAVAAATGTCEAEPAYPMSFDELQRRVLLDALDHSQGNKAQAARMLGMPKSTYNDRLRRLKWKEVGEDG